MSNMHSILPPPRGARFWSNVGQESVESRANLIRFRAKRPSSGQGCPIPGQVETIPGNGRSWESCLVDVKANLADVGLTLAHSEQKLAESGPKRGLLRSRDRATLGRSRVNVGGFWANFGRVGPCTLGSGLCSKPWAGRMGKPNRDNGWCASHAGSQTAQPEHHLSFQPV